MYFRGPRPKGSICISLNENCDGVPGRQQEIEELANGSSFASHLVRQFSQSAPRAPGHALPLKKPSTAGQVIAKIVVPRCVAWPELSCCFNGFPKRTLSNLELEQIVNTH